MLKKGKILIIKAAFYEDITNNLFDSAVNEIKNNHFQFDEINVPGAFEIPATIAMHKDKNYDGFIILGCVIKGQTSHFDYICQGLTYGITKLSIKYKLSIGFGVLTVDNHSQALDRSARNNKNYGFKAAKACIEMIKISKKINES